MIAFQVGASHEGRAAWVCMQLEEAVFWSIKGHVSESQAWLLGYHCDLGTQFPTF